MIDLSQKIKDIQESPDAEKYSEEGLKRLKETLKTYEGEDRLMWWSEIESRLKNEPRKPLHKTGIAPLDDVIGGFREKQLVILAGDSGHGKCLGLGTKILMHDGTVKKVEDVVVGDKLMGPDSKPRTVLSLARGREEMYKISQRGAEYIVNKSHILSLKTSGRYNKKGEKYNVGKVVNLTVEEFINQSPTFKNQYKGWMTGVSFPKKKVSLDPYYLGVWLGDGSASVTTITTPEPEIQEFLVNYASSLGMFGVVKDNRGKCDSVTLTKTQKGQARQKNPILEKLRELNLIENKHIPQIYKVNDRETRLQVLAGILDTDGYLYNRNGVSYDLIQKSKQLAEDIVFLARSLGFSAVVSPCKKGIKSRGFSGVYYRIRIAGELSVIPVKVARRKTNHKPKTNVLLSTISVEPLGVGDYYGFSLDGDRLFMLDSFVVTHNTLFSMYILSQMPTMSPVMIPLEQSAEELIEQRGENNYQIPKILSPDNLPPRVTTNWIEERIVEGIAKYNTKLVLIDHLGYVDNDGEGGKNKRENLAYRVGEVMRDLKGIAKRWDVVIMVLVHISQHDEGLPPNRKDIKNSSDIIQECDLAMFVWRKNSLQKKIRVYDNKTLLSIQKNRRSGKNANIGFDFDATTGWYKEENTWVKQMEEAAWRQVGLEDSENDF